MKKRTVIIIAIALGMIALGVGAYFAWKNRAVIQQIIPGIVTPSITPIESTKQRLRVLSSRGVFGYWVGGLATSSEIFYIAQDGNVLKIDKNNIEEVISKNGFSGMREFQSAKEGTSVVVSARGVGENRYNVYDVARNEWSITSGDGATLSSDGARIAVKAALPYPQLMIQDVDTLSGDAPATSILPLVSGEFSLQWPQRDSIYITQKPSAETISDLWRIDIKTKALKKILSDRGLIVQWSPFGDRALEFTTTAGREHKLTLIDGDGNRLREFKFVTLPDKCVMTTTSQMYCAIPRDQESLTHMTLPDDYLKRSVYFKDGIYQIDIDKDSIRGIFEDENPDIDATNLTIMGDKLLFINRYDRKLYSLDLQ